MFDFLFGKKKFPPQDLSHIDPVEPSTPDMWKLERRTGLNLFVYDDTQKGHPNHDMLEPNPVQRWTAFTQKSYVMWKCSSGESCFPIPLEPTPADLNTNAPWNRVAPIRGMVYTVHATAIRKLDRLKENRTMFIRQRVTLVVPTSRVVEVKDWGPRGKPVDVGGKSRLTLPNPLQTVEAFMYVGNRKYWDRRLDGGYLYEQMKPYTPDARKHFPDFHYFSKKEYNDE